MGATGPSRAHQASVVRRGRRGSEACDRRDFHDSIKRPVRPRRPDRTATPSHPYLRGPMRPSAKSCRENRSADSACVSRRSGGVDLDSSGPVAAPPRAGGRCGIPALDPFRPREYSKFPVQAILLKSICVLYLGIGTHRCAQLFVRGRALCTERRFMIRVPQT